ncbi:MAG: diaminopimelate epimerase [Acidobacteria bacterium]|nr:diaminopimelate epimerase [Acidobacteriota bacterium]
MRFAKAHAYGNDFIYVPADEPGAAPLDALARELCDRHAGIGADGLILYRLTEHGAAMTLFNADGSRSEVSGNGVRGLGALLVREGRVGERGVLTIRTEAGPKVLTRLGDAGGRPLFRAQMGSPEGIRRIPVDAGGESLDLAVLNIGNPQCIVLGPLPDEARFRRLGAALERHPLFPERTNVEFVAVEAPDRLRILIWERGVGPTSSSGTGACASLVAAASFGGAARDAQVVAPGGAQRVEWLADGVYLSGWAEVVCRGEWLRPLPDSRT